MISYPYIRDVFTAVLTQSNAIEGRFHISHQYGAQEINSDRVGEVIKALTWTKKYPLALMVPPHSQGLYGNMGMEWERFRIIMYFTKTSYYDSNNKVINPNVKTKTSTHSILEDWHDMNRCKTNFLRALDNLQRKTPGSMFRLPQNQVLTIPFSEIGEDRASGVRVDFDFDVFLGCTTEDYVEYPSVLTISLDSHPEHKL